MENLEVEIKAGEYQVYITGVRREDKNGYTLKTSKGNIFENLKLVVLDNGVSHSILHAIYGTDNVKSIVYAIKNPALTFVFESKQSKGEKFELENLIGESARVLLGHREYQGKKYPKVECFLKTKEPLFMNDFQASAPTVSRGVITNINSESGQSFREELDQADNVPF